MTGRKRGVDPNMSKLVSSAVIILLCNVSAGTLKESQGYRAGF